MRLTTSSQIENLNITKENDLSKLDAKALIRLKSLRDHILNELIQKASDLRLNFW